MKKPSPISLTVIKSEHITTNMQRITLHSEALANFPIGCAGNYIKLLFNAAGTTDLSALHSDARPVLRTYTIRRYSAEQCTIEIDFVRHASPDKQCGFATRWASQVAVGESIHVAGPGNIQAMNTAADWFFMVADMTALPALSAKMRVLAAHAKGYAVIKVIAREDIQAITVPENFKLIWLTQEDSLADTVRSLPWLDGQVSAWAACEFDDMRALRRYFRNEKKVTKDYIYLSSYWKKGVSEDGHKVIKQKDSQEND